VTLNIRIGILHLGNNLHSYLRSFNHLSLPSKTSRRFYKRLFVFEQLELRLPLDGSTEPFYLYSWEVYASEKSGLTNDEHWGFVSKSDAPSPTLDVDTGRHSLSATYSSFASGLNIGGHEGYAQASVKAVQTDTVTSIQFQAEHVRSFTTNDPWPNIWSPDEIRIDVVVYTRASHMIKVNTSSTSTMESSPHGIRGGLTTDSPLAQPRVDIYFPANQSVPGGQHNQSAGPGIVPQYLPALKVNGSDYWLAQRFYFFLESAIRTTAPQSPPFSFNDKMIVDATAVIEPLCGIDSYNFGACKSPYIESVTVEPGFKGQLPRNEDGTNSVSDGKTLVQAPTTLLPLELRAIVIDTMSSPRYQLQGVRWFTSFDGTDGPFTPVGRRYTQTYFTPASTAARNQLDGSLLFSATIYPGPEQFGTDKQVTATLEYRDTWTGDIAQSFKDAAPFDMFFDKFGDDDLDGVANWYQYWAKERLGATSHHKHGVSVNGVTYYFGGGPVADLGLLGGTHLSDRKITLYNSASLSSSYEWVNIPTNKDALVELWPNSSVKKKGIDAVEAVLAHERAHLWLYDERERLKQLGVLESEFDTDNDYVPDQVERDYARFGFVVGSHASLGTKTIEVNGIRVEVPIFTVSKGKDGHGNDEELFCELAALGAIKEVRLLRPFTPGDLANPGRNTKPVFLRNVVETGSSAQLTSRVSLVLDEDGLTKLHSTVGVNIEVDVEEQGTYTLSATLEDPDGNLQFAYETVYLEVGQRDVFLTLDAEKIRMRRVDGVFKIRDVMLLSAGDEQVLDETFLTPYLNSSEFGSSQRAVIQSAISASILRSETGDRKMDLSVEVKINAMNMGLREMTLVGYLYSASGSYIGAASTSKILRSGDYTFELVFTEEQLKHARLNSGVELRYVSLIDNVDPSRARLDFLPKVTLPIVFDDSTFGASDARIETLVANLKTNSPVSGSPVMRTTVQLNVAVAGNYILSGRLYTRTGQFVVEVQERFTLSTGRQLVDLDFDTIEIATAKLDGPFEIRMLQLTDSLGNIVDVSPFGEITSDYFWGEFTKDTLSPNSSVRPLLAVSKTPSFDVSWAGADNTDGTGIRTFDVYYSDNGAPYVRWLENSTLTTSSFTGAYGHQYAFYSIATDNAKNREIVPLLPDVVIRVAWPYFNTRQREDVNSDGFVTALDVLIPINFINANRNWSTLFLNDVNSNYSTHYIDVSDDGRISPIDILMVINYLNRQGRPNALTGEGEDTSTSSAYSAAINDRGYSSVDEVFSDLSFALDLDNHIRRRRNQF
jgi:hypothetical protein